MKKVGIIRCEQTEDMCPGTTDFKVASQGTHVFQETGPVEVIGFISCGGCPGKKTIGRAKTMIERGAQIIVFASCIKKGTPIGYPCPYFTKMRNAIKKAVEPKIQILDYTH